MYKAVSPIYNIPNIDERKLPPQFITSASEDRVTPVHAIEEYVKALKDAGQLQKKLPIGNTKIKDMLI